MKQLVTDFAKGRTFLADVPLPAPRQDEVLVKSRLSLISTGTERMVVDFGRSSLIKKARSQPAKVRQVLAKAKTDGIFSTYDAVKSKLSAPLGLGYCNVGTVVAVGENIRHLKPGDRLVSNGPHAEYFTVGQNLCAKVPHNVPDTTAVATVAAAIGLQGLRLAEPTLGEAVAVIGAGLIGLLTVQLLLAHGCRVLAIDLDQDRLALAQSFGAETCLLKESTDPVAAAMQFSRGRGVDAVLIATATQSHAPVKQAAQMCRRNGRIVLTGTAGLNIDRDDFYKKEISFRVSCSYGPGRYDPGYEEKGQDYPVGFVRWTEQRNFEAVLDLMAAGKIVVAPMISQHFDFGEAATAYDALARNRKALAFTLGYQDETIPSTTIRLKSISEGLSQPASGRKLAFIGAGNYASRVLIPAFRKAGAQFGTIASNKGFSAALVGQSAGFQEATTDTHALLADPDHDTVIIATRHQTHASLAAVAIENGKNVFVEKPLAIDHGGLDKIEKAMTTARTAGHSPKLMVGFNRRFSPHVVKLKQWMSQRQAPKAIIITVNSGTIPPESWVHEKSSGGGRIVGEACHFIDLLRHLADSTVTKFEASAMLGSHAAEQLRDTATITLRFLSGSIGTIHYFANGNATFPKERIEVFEGGSIVVLDNFRKLVGYGAGTPSGWSLRQDKGQVECARAFLKSVNSGTPAPISIEEIFEVSRLSIDIAAALDAQA